MGSRTQWRRRDGRDSVLMVDDDGVVRRAVAADARVLSMFLTDLDRLDTVSWEASGRGEQRDPGGWGDLVLERSGSGEVTTMDPERFWDGIYEWFRSRGVDYDTDVQ